MLILFFFSVLSELDLVKCVTFKQTAAEIT